jgi:two-component system cell cycle sensor histidine kinase/response regulator CckA
VEDDPRLRDVIRAYLQSKGYTILEAPNADEALSICANLGQHIHLLVTDVVMPGLDGVGLAQSALKLRQDLKIILLSGYTDRMLDIESLAIKALFLQKPFSLEALGRLARSLFDRERENQS